MKEMSLVCITTVRSEVLASQGLLLSITAPIRYLGTTVLLSLPIPPLPLPSNSLGTKVHESNTPSSLLSSGLYCVRNPKRKSPELLNSSA